MPAIKGVLSICYSCLRFVRPPRRLPVPARALFHSTRNLHFQGPTHQSPDDDLLNAFSESSPYNSLDPVSPESPTKLAHSDIISLKEHLDSNNLSAAYQLFSGLTTSRVFPGRNASGLGSYVSHVTLLPTVDRLFEGIVADGGKTADLPAPLDLLRKMEELEISSTNHYTTLLISRLRDGSSVDEILAAFDAAISFNSERLHQVMLEINELGSLTLDVATPHFIAFLVLRDKAVLSESLSKLESVMKHSPYPSSNHLDHFLDHHHFSDTTSSYILDLHEAFYKTTLFTNKHTLKQTISRANTPDALQALYTHVRTSSPTPLPPYVYSHFITAFMALKDPTTAFTVWSDMTASGIIPSVIEWNELMKALSTSQDKSPILPLWNKMLQSGVMPDHHCWTTRIHSLLNSNHTSEGLASLRAMQDAKITPTTETINAVLDGLLKHDHLPEAAKVLAVAEKLGIKKDLWTYNTLLHSLLKQQKHDAKKFNEILALTRQMQSEGIVPDIMTVTLILDGMYKFSSSKPTLNSVLSLLEYIEASGISANVWTYTSIIRALLAEGNEPAAMDILAVMEARGMSGSTATYTVLLKHYFAKRDSASVDRILAEMAARRIQYDSRMWREIAWGFAGMREVQRMKETMERMYKSGAGMGLKGYMSVLLALQKGGLVVEAKELVEDLLERGVVGGGMGERTGVQAAFWSVVKTLGEGSVMRELERTGKVEEDE